MDVVENTIKMIVCHDSKALIRHIDTDGNVYQEDYNKLNSYFPIRRRKPGPVTKGAENVVYCVKRLLSCDGKYDVPLEKHGGIDMDGVGASSTMQWAA